MKKIGIVADSISQFKHYIELDLKLNPNSEDVRKKYHYITIYEYECVSGIELESFIIISPRLNEMYHFFKKIESRVRN